MQQIDNHVVAYIPDSSDIISIGKVERYCMRHHLTLYKIYHNKQELFSELKQQSLVILTDLKHLGSDHNDRMYTKRKLLEDHNCNLFVRNKFIPLDSRIGQSRASFNLLINMALLIQSYQDNYESSDEEQQ